MDPRTQARISLGASGLMFRGLNALFPPHGRNVLNLLWTDTDSPPFYMFRFWRCPMDIVHSCIFPLDRCPRSGGFFLWVAEPLILIMASYGDLALTNLTNPCRHHCQIHQIKSNHNNFFLTILLSNMIFLPSPGVRPGLHHTFLISIIISCVIRHLSSRFRHICL